MGASPVRPARAGKGGGSLPKPLLAVLITSLAAMLALSVTHLAHGGARVPSRRGRQRPRVLLQPGDVARGQHPEGALYAAKFYEAAAAAAQQDAAEQAEQLQSGEPGAAAASDDPDESGGSYFGSLFEALSSSVASVSPVGTGNPAAAAATQHIASPVGTGEPRSSSLLGAGGGAAGAAGGEPAGDEPLLGELTLDPTSDLATFADPGTHCVLKPAHSKARGAAGRAGRVLCAGRRYRAMHSLACIAWPPCSLSTLLPLYPPPRRWRCCSSPKRTCRTT